MDDKELRKIFSSWVPPRYLNQKQAVAYTGTSPGTIKDWVRQGLKQIIFTESSWPKYDVKDLDAWMEKFKI